MQKHGFIVFWTDYVKIDRGEDGETKYSQSDNPKRGYKPRTMAMTKGPDQDIYISAAVAFQKELSKKAARDLAYGRLMNILEDKGVPETIIRGFVLPRRGMTLVPKEYLDLVLLDPYCYGNLYGPPNIKTFWDKVANIYDGQGSTEPQRTSRR